MYEMFKKFLNFSQMLVILNLKFCFILASLNFNCLLECDIETQLLFI